MQQAKAWLKQLGLFVKANSYRAALFGVLSGICLIAFFAIVSLVVHGVLIEEWLTNEAMIEILWPYAAAMFTCILFRGLTQYFQEQYATDSSLIIKRKVRQHIMQSWHQYDLRELSKASTAVRSNHFIEQVDALEGYFARFIPQLKIATWLPLIILLITFYLDWIAGTILLISAPLIPIFMAIVGMGAESISQRHFVSLERLSSQFLDKVKGLRALQSFGQIEQAKNGLTESSEQFRILTMKTLKIAFLSSAVLEFFSAVAIAVLAMYIGFGLLGYINWGPSSELSLFSGLLILLLAPEFFQPLRTLAQHYHDRASAIGAAAQLIKVTGSNEQASHSDANMANPQASDQHQLVVNNISKHFKKRGKLFSNLSFTAHKGDIIVVKGKSGVGKSTLLQLLAGFDTPDTGNINIFSRSPGAEPCAWLSQNPFTLFGSWRDNLNLLQHARNEVANEEAMLNALHSVDLLERVKMNKHGLDEVLGESSHGLSGGQAQRLALARTMLSPFPLILLDEPTAALDAKSAEIVIESLKALANQQRLIVVASHDEAIMQAATQVIDLDTLQ